MKETAAFFLVLAAAVQLPGLEHKLAASHFESCLKREAVGVEFTDLAITQAVYRCSDTTGYDYNLKEYLP